MIRPSPRGDKSTPSSPADPVADILDRMRALNASDLDRFARELVNWGALQLAGYKVLAKPPAPDASDLQSPATDIELLIHQWQECGATAGSHALVNELARRVRIWDRSLSEWDRAALYQIRPKEDACFPAEILALPEMQGRLMKILEPAGSGGVPDDKIRKILWPYDHDSAPAKTRLRKLIYDTNASLKKIPGQRRRIQKASRGTRCVKNTAKALPRR
jgi:hypothetical protein